MAIKLGERLIGDVLIIDIAGRITLGEGSGSLREAIQIAVAQGQKKVILNMADTAYVDSCGISEIVNSFVSLANLGGVVKLLALTARVKDLLQITKLYTVFDVYEIEDEAVRSFNELPAVA